MTPNPDEPANTATPAKSGNPDATGGAGASGAHGMSRARRILFAVVLAFGGAVVALYVSEAAFRTVVLQPLVPETDRQFARAVSDHWPQPVAHDKEPGTVRILGLSDSFGVAGGHDNYHYVLERILRDKRYAVEVVNLSVPGYAPAHEAELLKRFAERYEPDIVLHGFFVGNDFGVGSADTSRFRGIDIERRGGLSGWLPHNLTLTRWLARSGRASADRRQVAREREAGLGDGSFSHDAFLEIERVRMGACRRPRRDGVAWPGTTAVLDELTLAIRDLPARHVLLVHPDQFQVEPALAGEVFERFELDPDDYDLDQPQRFLNDYARSRKIAFLDLTYPLRQAGRDGGLFLSRDTHYNASGNRLVAEVVAGALEPMVARVASGATR